MGFYTQRVVPRIIDKACGMKTVYPLRERVCAGLSGEVVEVGAGIEEVTLEPRTGS